MTSVLCVGDRWFSASHDGSVLHAPLMPPHPTSAGNNGARGANGGASGGGGGGGDADSGSAPRLLDYPILHSFVEGTEHTAIGSNFAGKLELIPPPKHTMASVKGAADGPRWGSSSRTAAARPSCGASLRCLPQSMPRLN